MNLSDYTFIALDLETTGLSKEKDTIIEIAAIKFHLKKDGASFAIEGSEEKSMLINPGRKLEDNISMITGITDSMLKDKPSWDEVRERVRLFIGEDAIIVGHNVLFDVAMLSTHGIDLNKNIILDTFELSELFSFDAESLNLGFLAKKYGFDDGSEHRALDDTRLSMSLFLHYLSEIRKLSSVVLSLWEYARTRDTSNTIDILLKIIGNNERQATWTHTLLSFSLVENIKKTPPIQSSEYSVISLPPNWEEEEKIIRKILLGKKTLLLTSSKKQSLWLTKKLQSQCTVFYKRERASYLSLRMLRAWLDRTSWERKETILTLRLAQWILITNTGSVDEIKWYGEELQYKTLFQLGEDEETEFLKRDNEKAECSNLIIAEYFPKESYEQVLQDSIECVIIRDIVELESNLRYYNSVTISWSEMRSTVSKLSLLSDIEKRDIEFSLSIIEEIVTQVIHRPSGPNLFPPGDYGETYFYTQEQLWHRGYIWLVWAGDTLEALLESFQGRFEKQSIIERTYFSHLKKTLASLIQLGRIGNENINIILQIKESDTKITLVARSVKRSLEQYLGRYSGKKVLLTGYNIEGQSIKKFLREECGIILPISPTLPGEKISKIHDTVVIRGEKSVILGTNLKQLRALSSELKKQFPDYTFFTQGISGGKGKMLSLFQSSKKGILLGLIDTWRDESELWERVDTVSILKIPFDPPNDPYYLARTTGMSNNFENYSLPIAIHTINTLIGRCRSANNDMNIYIIDEKLTLMNWGKSIFPEIL